MGSFCLGFFYSFFWGFGFFIVVVGGGGYFFVCLFVCVCLGFVGPHLMVRTN